MSAESVQFAEMVRIEHARIELLKQAADERGEIIENLTAAYLRGEMDEQTYNDLLARVCRNEAQ
ncbi:MAG TPA: hypothetical protein PLA27_17800 [Anaerolineales bacterium]|jgi:hypothetical protein|nr:hypothetical protein [Anaerolineales bacterium]